MRYVICLFASAVSLLAGCVTAEIATDPLTFDLDPSRLARLQPGRTFSIENGYADEVQKKFKLRGSTWIFNQKQLTDTAIVMLSRAMQKRDLKVTPQSDKTVTLRVLVLRAGMHTVPMVAFVDARVGLEAKFGDGTVTYVEADNSSPGGAPRAYDGAVLFALNQLADDPKFVVYMSR